MHALLTLTYSSLAGRSMKFASVIGRAAKLPSGHDIPRIGMGISRNRGQESLDQSICAALEAGYRLFDTAHIYENEAELGVALEKYLPVFNLTREDVFITTKVPIRDGDPRGNVDAIVKESLQKLRTDYIDLVLVHYPKDRFEGKDNAHEVNKKSRRETWQRLEEIHTTTSSIRSIGVSNYEIFHLLELAEYAKITPSVNQCEFHPYYCNWHLRHYCDKKGIFFQAFSSLCWGNQEILNEKPISEAAKKYGVSPQIILYAFALNCGVGIIPKSATPARIVSNLHDSSKITFTREELDSMLALDKNLAFCPGCNPWACM